MDYEDINIMYATAYKPPNGYLYRSTNNCNNPNFNWPSGFINVDENVEGAILGAPLIMDPFDSEIMYQCRINVWRTDDAHNVDPDSWTKISDWENDFQYQTGGAANALEIAPNNPDYLYTAVWWDAWTKWILFRGIYNETLDIWEWSDITLSLSPNEYTISDIAVSSHDPDHIWITYQSYESPDKVKVSTDGGEIWVSCSANLPNLPVNCIVYLNGSNDLIFIGTDVGTYYRNAEMDQWEPFMNDLPNVVVKWLEINYNANKLRAATFGRGLFETPLPCLFNETPIVISDNQTWETLKFIYQNIEIVSGASLTIKSRVNMTSQAKIIIHEGGTLMLDGGTITSACQSPWQGIEVEGNPSLEQIPTSNQGMLTIMNEGTIKDAVTGITDFNPNQWNNF